MLALSGLAYEEEAPLEWKLKKGDALFQELIVSQKPTFRTQGLVLQSILKYSVLSKFVVDEVGPGGVTISQRIDGIAQYLGDIALAVAGGNALPVVFRGLAWLQPAQVLFDIAAAHRIRSRRQRIDDR